MNPRQTPEVMVALGMIIMIVPAEIMMMTISPLILNAVLAEVALHKWLVLITIFLI